MVCAQAKTFLDGLGDSINATGRQRGGSKLLKLRRRKAV